MNGMNMLVGKEWSVGYFLKVIIFISNCKFWGYQNLFKKWLL